MRCFLLSSYPPGQAVQPRPPPRSKRLHVRYPTTPLGTVGRRVAIVLVSDHTTKFGYSLMCEEHHPSDLVADGGRAEAAGMDFLTISDHFHPWLYSHEHSPYAWSVLGALAATTRDVRLVSLVTCPFLRYHPAIVAQKAATVAAMSGGRFDLGLGAGENLNEHVVGRGWPPVRIRHEMLAESVEVITRLWEGGYHSFDGAHVRVDDARIFTLPDAPPPLHIAVSGPDPGSTRASPTSPRRRSATRARSCACGSRSCRAACARRWHQPSTGAAATGGARGSDPAPRPGTR